MTLGGITGSVCSREAGTSPPRRGRETDGRLLCYSRHLLGHEQIVSEKYTRDRVRAEWRQCQRRKDAASARWAFKAQYVEMLGVQG